MMTDTSITRARETVAWFDQKIAELEHETRQKVERLRAADYSYASEQVEKEWDACAERTRPLRDARERLVTAVAAIVGMTKPPPMVIRKSGQ